MIFISVVLREDTHRMDEVVPVRRVDRRILSEAQELCKFLRNPMLHAEIVIEDDEDDFRFVVMIPARWEFKIGGEKNAVDDWIHAYIVPEEEENSRGGEEKSENYFAITQQSISQYRTALGTSSMLL